MKSNSKYKKNVLLPSNLALKNQGIPKTCGNCWKWNSSVDNYYLIKFILIQRWQNDILSTTFRKPFVTTRKLLLNESRRIACNRILAFSLSDHQRTSIWDHLNHFLLPSFSHSHPVPIHSLSSFLCMVLFSVFSSL